MGSPGCFGTVELYMYRLTCRWHLWAMNPHRGLEGERLETSDCDVQDVLNIQAARGGRYFNADNIQAVVERIDERAGFDQR